MTLFPFTSFQVKATGSRTGRTMPDRFAEIINVKDWGATGDGATDDTSALQAAINAAFGSASSPNGSSNYFANKALFFPNGQYKISAPLVFTSVQGGWIYGAGKRATQIVTTATNGTVFSSNGFAFCMVEAMTLTATGTGLGFNMDWSSGPVSLHANTFRDVRFEAGNYGCGIGASGFMGSEILFLDCDFVSCASGIAGFQTNALDYTVIGGTFQSCGIGLNCHQASTFPYVSSVGFTGSTTSDIRFDSFHNMAVEACTSDSAIFGDMPSNLQIIFSGCTYSPAPTGEFCRTEGVTILDGCLSTNSILQGSGGYNGANVYERGSALPATFISGSAHSPNVVENI